jgi:hypothetical protein
MSNQRDTASREAAFKEIHEGKTYAKTKRKHGTKVANKQAVAIYFSKKRRGELKGTRKKASGKR